MPGWLLVGVGGFAGCVIRYACVSWVHRITGTANWPWGTLAVNVAGCFLIGLLGGIWAGAPVSSPKRLLLVVGLLGGMTTFSAFGFDTLELLRQGRFLPALSNVLAQVVFGLLAVWAGMQLGRIFGQ